MRRLLLYLDKIALVACVLLFLGIAVWAALRFRQVDEIGRMAAASVGSPAKHEPQFAQTPTIAQVSWPEPAAQSQGREWVFDTFTPPVLYYDPVQKTFTVTPPVVREVAPVVAETPFEVELVSVRQEPYRIQLKGYSGTEAAYTAHLEVIDTGETVLGRPGQVFPEARGNFAVRSFEVRRITTTSEGSMPVVENVAFAVILDSRTGREVTLTNREPLMLPRLQCVLRTRVFPAEEHALREGMKITVNGYDYTVMQLSMNPAQAVVSRKKPSEFVGETRTLIPVGESPMARLAPVSPGQRDNSIDSPVVSLFANSRHSPLRR